ncbi:MAG: DUF547 domain-containing protein [Candidatus Omnitrophica bacterium]|nr:DUF547 domain-containing protein [Candidatus Omnitrophota bacterium]
MRKVLFFLAFLFLFLHSTFAAPPSLNHSKWDRILKTYVHDSLVDYKSLLQRRTELDDYLKELEAIPIETLAEASREERIAFWINLYNATAIRMVLDEYPIEGFDQIPAAFEIRTIRVIDEFYSLAELRDEILRKGFGDERILTALVSARMDSPKIMAEAFRGELLDEQLDRAARQFVGDQTRNQIEPGKKKIFLSPLFRTFGNDFLLNYSSEDSASKFSEIETAVISFILHYLESPEKRLFLDQGRYQIDYLKEDPRLNEARMGSKVKI